MKGPFLLKDFKQETPATRELLFWWTRDEHKITVRYQLTPHERVKWPAAVTTERAYNLWQSTCFELFLKEEGLDEYYEFNFSPDGRWDAYTFSDYRQPQPPKRLEECRVEFSRIKSNLIELTLSLPFNRPLIGNATAVIEDDRGLHYFALEHAKERADFHHPSTLVLKLDEL